MTKRYKYGPEQVCGDFNSQGRSAVAELLEAGEVLPGFRESGDPTECAEKIRELYQASGGFGSLLAITVDSDDPEWDQESLTLLIEEVGPKVAELTG